jgi:hypothetical protein
MIIKAILDIGLITRKMQKIWRLNLLKKPEKSLVGTLYLEIKMIIK